MESEVASVDGFHFISVEGPMKAMKTEGVALITADIQIQI
jgi:hypothetical protein